MKVCVDSIPRNPMSSAKETVNKPQEIYQSAKLTVKQTNFNTVSICIFHKVSHQMKIEIYAATYQMRISRQRPNEADHIYRLFSLLMGVHE